MESLSDAAACAARLFSALLFLLGKVRVFVRLDPVRPSFASFVCEGCWGLIRVPEP